MFNIVIKIYDLYIQNSCKSRKKGALGTKRIPYEDRIEVVELINKGKGRVISFRLRATYEITDTK